MENFIVSARKYRPLTFDTVVGQKAITTTLKNAIQNNHLAHAYLFCGPRGVGKTSCARIFAKTINCSNISDGMEACNNCESCLAFNQNRSYNIHELDAASNNSVEDIRTLIDQVRIPPQIGNYSIYIIDEVHMLSASAFNAFLKTLEEPPKHAIFILATTEKHKIIPTILSRCQIFDFNRIGVSDAVQHLQYVAQHENVTVEEEGLNVIAQKADGAMRDALSIFDQIVSFSGNNITYQDVIGNLNVLDFDYYFRIVDSFLGSKVTDVLLLFNEIIEKGFDGHHFITGLSAHLRDVLIGKDTSTLQLLEVADSVKKKYLEQAKRCPMDFLFDALKILSQCDVNYKASQNKRLFVELTLIQLSQIIESKKKSTSLDSEIPIIHKIMVPADKPAALSASQQQVNERPVQPFANNNNRNPEKTVQQGVVNNVTPPAPGSQKGAVSYQTKAKTFSIKEALSGGMPQGTSSHKNNSQPGRKISNAVSDQRESFTQKSVESQLKDFVTVKKINDRIRCALTAHTPLVGENDKVVLRVDNSLQEDDINKMKSEILNFLKRQLHNTHIELTTQIIETHSEKKLYTDTDRFNYLCEKNPVLGLLKQKFSLDFE